MKERQGEIKITEARATSPFKSLYNEQEMFQNYVFACVCVRYTIGTSED